MSSDENGSTFSYTKAAASDVASIKALIGTGKCERPREPADHDGGRKERM